MLPQAGRVVQASSMGQKLQCSGPFQTPHYVPLYLAVIYILYNKLASVSKCSVSCSSKLIEPLIYSQSVRSTGNNVNLRLASEGGGHSLVHCTLNPWDLMLSPV